MLNMHGAKLYEAKSAWWLCILVYTCCGILEKLVTDQAHGSWCFMSCPSCESPSLLPTVDHVASWYHGNQNAATAAWSKSLLTCNSHLQEQSAYWPYIVCVICCCMITFDLQLTLGHVPQLTLAAKAEKLALVTDPF